MKALVANRMILTRVINLALGKSLRRGADITEVPKPHLSPSSIIVRVHAVALNPIDFKSMDFISPRQSILGCDFAGEVAEVGDQAAKKWRVGDRVAGAVFGGLYPDQGSFAEYLQTESDLVWRVPHHMDLTDAATYGISGTTAMYALNHRLGLPWPRDKHTPAPNSRTILIYAGSTSAGLFHLQIAKAMGCTVVTTASPKSFELVKQYGADAVFDYRSANLVEQITQLYPKISEAIDCFSEGQSTDICAQVVKNTGGKVITLLPRGQSKTPGVEYESIMLHTVFGKAFQWLPPIGPKFPVVPGDREWFAEYCAKLPQLVGFIKPVPTKVMTQGFDDIFVGLDLLRQGRVSGQKLVVKLK